MTDPTEGVVANPSSPAALEAFVASVQHLPLFTGTAVQLIRSVEQEDANADELSRLISTDAALTAHLLRLVNSSFYGLSRRIGTISDALMVLGFNLVRRTVTAAVLERPLLAYLHDSAAARAFWRHELLCAALARHLAGRAKGNGEVAYMAGLLHDVGRLVMLMQYPEQSDLLLQRRSEDDDGGLVVERELFGFDHAQVGGALLESWGLPEEMVQAAHQHADETEPDEVCAASVWRANLISHEMDAATDDVDDDEVLPWMEAIGLTPKERRKILNEIAALESDRP